MSLSYIINDLHISNKLIDFDRTIADLVCDTVTPENVKKIEILKKIIKINVVNTQLIEVKQMINQKLMPKKIINNQKLV